MQAAGIYDSDVIQGAVLCGSLETDGAMIYDQTFFKFKMKSKKQIQKKRETCFLGGPYRCSPIDRTRLT